MAIQWIRWIIFRRKKNPLLYLFDFPSKQRHHNRRCYLIKRHVITPPPPPRAGVKNKIRGAIYQSTGLQHDPERSPCLIYNLQSFNCWTVCNKCSVHPPTQSECPARYLGFAYTIITFTSGPAYQRSSSSSVGANCAANSWVTC